MNAADREALARVEQRLGAIEANQRASRILTNRLINLLADIAGVPRPADRDEPTGGARHLRLVGRD